MRVRSRSPAPLERRERFLELSSGDEGGVGDFAGDGVLADDRPCSLTAPVRSVPGFLARSEPPSLLVLGRSLLSDPRFSGLLRSSLPAYNEEVLQLN